MLWNWAKTLIYIVSYFNLGGLGLFGRLSPSNPHGNGIVSRSLRRPSRAVNQNSACFIRLIKVDSIGRLLDLCPSAPVDDVCRMDSQSTTLIIYFIACWLGKWASKLSIRLFIWELAVSVVLCSKFYFFPLTSGHDQTSVGSSNLSGCCCRFLFRNFEIHAWTMWFWRSLRICQFHNFKSEFQLVKNVTRMAIPARQNK